VSEVGVQVEGKVAVLTIDRPHARNAIGLATIAELGEALDQIEQEPVNVLVMRGAGDRAFVSGGDLKELSAIRDEQGAIEMATRMRRLLDRVATFPVPVIAALNGHALGGGAEVAVAADIRIAADDVSIGFTQVALAIMPAWGGAERLAELVGRSRAMLLIAGGTRLSAAEAEHLGLVQTVALRAEFDAAWRELADSFARLPEGAGRAIKDVISAAKPHAHPLLEADAVRHFARLWVGEDHWRAAEPR
jgi:enoyl-CoA hydratase/carnithine racemase